jgi:hypothetical protein
MRSDSPKATRRRATPLDIPRKPLSIARLNYRRTAPDVERRVRSEFVEMRGFSPTIQQAARLFHLNQDECDELLTRLVREGFLRQTPDGRFRLPS